jgi:cobalt-zinc-cadmium efflux system membrane fusion protein
MAGIVREVQAVQGQEVGEGQVLALVESADFGQAKSDYLQAVAVLKLREAAWQREKLLAEKKIGTGREFLEAETGREEAKLAVGRAAQRLELLGVPRDRLAEVSEKQDTSALLELRAPFPGTVVEANAVRGEAVLPEKTVFAVAAMERMWLSIDVYESDLARIEKDQKVSFFVDGLTGRRFPGRVVAIGGEVDEHTRTIRVFADVKNVDGLLRARMFGRAEISIRAAEPKLLVPKEAVQNDGDCFLVFVSPSQDVFQARKIQLGTAYGQGWEVVGGLAAGEKVVTRGSFLLKTEILRGQMGAG